MREFILSTVLLVSVIGNALTQDSVVIKKTYSVNETITKHLDSVVVNWHVNESLKKMKGFDFKNPISFSDEEYSTNINGIQKEIPLVYNEHVKRYIDLYTGKKKRNFELVIGLSEFYLPFFETELSTEQLPTELKWLPVMSSALNPTAVSPSGSSGVWQMMYPMAIRYGLNVTSYIDDRRNYKKSTTAAIAYLKDLYSAYNDWTMVIAAYHSSPAVVNKAMARSGGKTDFWEIYDYLPEATRDYVPAFIAAYYAGTHQDQHNITSRTINMKPESGSFPVDRELHYTPVVKVIGIPIEMLRANNPTYRMDVVPHGDKPNLLKLPIAYSVKFVEMKDSIYTYQDSVYLKPPEPPEPITTKTPEYVPSSATPKNSSKVYYTIKSGDNLGFIASWYNVRVSQLQGWNDIYGNRITAGKKLVVHVPKGDVDYYSAIDKMSFDEKQKLAGKVVTKKTVSPKKTTTKKTTTKQSNSSSSNSGNYVYYTVRSGDSLWLIAKRYPGVSADNIKELNNLKNDALQPGQRLKIKKK